MYLDLSLYFHGNPWEGRDTYPDASVSASEVPGVWQRCSGAVLWEMYRGRPLNSRRRPWERACADEPGGCPGTTFASFPCQDLHLKWALCSARLGLCHVRGRMEDCACPVRPGESLQLSQSLILLTLWVPSLPSLWEEGAWRVGASLLHLWPLSKRLFSLHQTQFHYWQSKPGWRKNPLW